jgi:protein tyrosine/serine phosphatase
MHAARHVFVFFNGKTFGRGIEEARNELVEELTKSPHGERIWEEVKELHNRAITWIKTDISKEDFQEVLEARERYTLPTFEEIKKRYGVA